MVLAPAQSTPSRRCVVRDLVDASRRSQGAGIRLRDPSPVTVDTAPAVSRRLQPGHPRRAATRKVLPRTLRAIASNAGGIDYEDQSSRR